MLLLVQDVQRGGANVVYLSFHKPFCSSGEAVAIPAEAEALCCSLSASDNVFEVRAKPGHTIIKFSRTHPGLFSKEHGCVPLCCELFVINPQSRLQSRGAFCEAGAVINLL